MEITIRFKFSENADVDCDRVFTSIREASDHLYLASFSAPEGGCYDKTFFVVETGGDKYEGRIDLKFEDSATTDLAEHISEHCHYVSMNMQTWVARGMYTAQEAVERVQAAVHWQKVVIAAVDADIKRLEAVAAECRPVEVVEARNGQQGWGF